MKKIDLDNSLTTDFLVKLNKAREDKEERAYFQEVNIDAISATTAVMLLNAALYPDNDDILKYAQALCVNHTKDLTLSFDRDGRIFSTIVNGVYYQFFKQDGATCLVFNDKKYVCGRKSLIDLDTRQVLLLESYLKK